MSAILSDPLIEQALEQERYATAVGSKYPLRHPTVYFCVLNRLYLANEQTQELIPGQMTSYDSSLVLVCTHGSRDRCCGTLGGAIYAKAHKQAPEKVWQASHLGGHRFAPRCLFFHKE